MREREADPRGGTAPRVPCSTTAVEAALRGLIGGFAVGLAFWERAGERGPAATAQPAAAKPTPASVKSQWPAPARPLAPASAAPPAARLPRVRFAARVGLLLSAWNATLAGATCALADFGLPFPADAALGGCAAGLVAARLAGAARRQRRWAAAASAVAAIILHAPDPETLAPPPPPPGSNSA